MLLIVCLGALLLPQYKYRQASYCPRFTEVVVGAQKVVGAHKCPGRQSQWRLDMASFAPQSPLSPEAGTLACVSMAQEHQGLISRRPLPGQVMSLPGCLESIPASLTHLV